MVALYWESISIESKKPILTKEKIMTRPLVLSWKRQHYKKLGKATGSD